MRLLSSVPALSLLLLCRSLAAAELPFEPELPLPGVTGYDEAIPQPQETIGHRIGTRHTEPHQAVRYFRAVAQSSERVTFREHGRSYENRPLVHAIVTSPENHARLETLRKTNHKLSETPAAVSDEDLADRPAVVYLGYSIHGDEASGSEAAVLLLYHLAAGRGPAVKKVLENVVLIVDPLLNPDGRQRFTSWVNHNRGRTPVADPRDREHDQPWPGGRTNHYWFDLNRDWLLARHPESRARLRLFHDWRPQVLGDFHEMGSDAEYFFQPGVPTRVNPQTPRSNQRLTAAIARYHARALDRLDALYYTRETFDDFFPGKGSTYPDVNGGIGILFEQASSRALRRETENGLLTYAVTVRNQFATSISTLRASVELREKLLRHQREFYAGASTVAADSRTTAYLLPRSPHRTRAQELVRLLRRHRIRVHELARDVESDGRNFRAGEAYIVPVDQPQVRLLKVLLERRTQFDSRVFYDISAWTLPLAFGVKVRKLTEPAEAYLGEEIDNLPSNSGRLIGGRAGYAYLIPWGRYFAPRALSRLQQAGIRVRAMTRPFSATVEGESRTFPRGTLLVTIRQNQPDGVPARTIHELAQRIVEEDHLQLFAVESGLTPEGPDLGSRRSAAVLEQPEIALLTGPETRAYNAGEVWHLLSERFRVPVSLVDSENVNRTNLDRYDVLILAGGSYQGLDAEEIAEWVKNGGRLIAVGSAVDWAVEQKLVELEKKEFDLRKLLKESPYEELADARQAHRIPGTIFRAELDPTHPVAFGYDDTVALFRGRDVFYKPSPKPGTNVAVYADEPLLSGYVSPERLRQVPGSAALVAAERGRGAAILFMHNPNFRGFWYGTNGLFLNAVFLGGLL